MYSDIESGGNALQAKQANIPTLKTRLDGAVRDAEARLAEAKRAREILDAHPDLEELLNIMQRGRF
jgi:hypothetical protein